METLELRINGMSCGHCVGQVTKTLTELHGVTANRITAGHASISYDPITITARTILDAVKEAGFEPVVIGKVA